MSANRTLQANYLEGVKAPKNYITNGLATYNDVKGWATYDDGLNTQPVNGTGGTPVGFTFTSSNSLILSGDRSFKMAYSDTSYGYGASFDFTIDACDKAKVLQIEFDYIVESGTFRAGDSTNNSDITVWVYDVTNGQLIQPSTFKLMGNSSTVATRFVGSFQTASNSTDYRLCLHLGRTGAANFSLAFDNFSVSPSVYVYGSPISDWKSYTPTFGAGYGTTSNVKFFYRRVGDGIEVRGLFTLGTISAASSSISLPSGLAVDTTKIPSANSGSEIQVGYYGESSGSTNQAGPIVCEQASGTIFLGRNYNVTSLLVPSNVQTSMTGSGHLAVYFSVPISGYASTVQMSDSADSRIVAMNANANSGTYTNAVITSWANKPLDTHGAFNTSTGVFTVPIPGNYEATLHTFGSVAGNATIRKNGVDYVIGQSATRSFASAILTCNAGDTISAYITGGATTIQNDSTGTVFSIQRIAGPTSIAATETIAASYYASANGNTSTTASVNYDSRLYDTHSAVSASAAGSGVWRFTAPAPGIFDVKIVAISSSNNSWHIYKNGTIFVEIGGTSAGVSSNLSFDIKLLAGEYIDIRSTTSITYLGGSLTADNVCSKICIKRVGIF